MSRSADARGGFTLLEVLGAVLVIGVAFTLLAGANIEGLRAEGVARRELEASLIADRRVAELEAQLQLDSVPPPGRRETEEDGFRVLVDVTPIFPALPPLPADAPGDFADDPRAPTLFPPAGRGPREGYLRHVRIEVAWDDGAFERSVVRDSFVFDRALAGPVLQPLAEAEAAAGAGQELR